MEGFFGYLWMILQTILALGIVCGLAYLLFRVLLPRLTFLGSNNTMVRVVERVPLDSRKSVFVVEVTGRWLLLGSSEEGLSLIEELDPKTARDAAKTLYGDKKPTPQAMGGDFVKKMNEVIGGSEKGQ